MKVLIIGLGSIGKKHIASLKKIDNQIDIYALRSKRASTESRDCKSIYSLKDIEVGEISFVIISNPTYLHTETISQLLSYHIPFFIEKPLSDKLVNLESIIKKIREEKLISYVACNLRFHPSIKFLKKNIKSFGKIEEVNVYCGSNLKEWRKGVDFRKTYSAHKEQGGGVHLDLIHEIDYCYWLLGEPKTVKANFESKSSLNINAVDQANYILKYDTFNTNISLNYFRVQPKRSFEILTDNDVIQLDLLTSKVTNKYNKIIFEDSDFEISNTYDYQMNYFVNEILSGREEFNSIEEAYKVLKICIQ